MKSGIVVIDKEQNKTSRDVVNEVCKIFHTKKVGHTGTLDPIATGVLVVAINEGCKIIEFLMSDAKEYIAEVVIGMTSDTLDVTGILQEEVGPIYKNEEIEKVLASFVGSYEQEVPKYSAVHVNGKRLYEYAREKKEVELPKRLVEIKSIKLIESKEENEHQVFSFQVTVSKGTYIRSLIRDIGKRLGSPCIMKNLRRTRQGIFHIDQAKKVQNLKESDIISLKDALSNFPSMLVNEDKMLQKIQNGCKLPNQITEDTCFVDNQGHLLAIYTPVGDMMKPVKVFLNK